MYRQYRQDRRLQWLDERTMQLHWIDLGIRPGRIQGETHEMLRRIGKSEKYERTPEYRLQRHYEREYNRILKGQPK